jgi:hypothetical protein
MKGLLRFAAALILVACLIQTAGAGTVDYNLTEIGGGRWQYDYTITNDFADDIFAFSIHFKEGASNLAPGVNLTAWEECDTDMWMWQDNWLVFFQQPFGV